MPSFFACARPSRLWTALLLALPVAGTAADTATLNNVAVLAATCANCHGPDGHSPGAIPSLRGLPAEHLLQRMQAFKAGKAADATVMTRLMTAYDDAQIHDLAQWFSVDLNNKEVR